MRAKKSAPQINNNQNLNISVTTTENNILISDFEFSLAETYTSREEILKEREALEIFYYDYQVGRRREEYSDEYEKYVNLDNELYSMLYIYPPSEQEILDEKERMLNEKVAACMESLSFSKKYADSHNLTNEEKERIEELYKEYIEASEIKDNYDSGKITIDTALEILEVEPTRLLLSYYEQIEAAKN